MSNDWILVLAWACACIGFCAGVLVAMPRRGRPPRDMLDFQKNMADRGIVVRLPFTKERQTGKKRKP